MVLTVDIEKVRRGKNKDYVDYDGYPLYKGVFSILDENDITWKPDGNAFKIPNQKIRGEVNNDQTVCVCMEVYEEHIQDYLDLVNVQKYLKNKKEE